MTPRTTSDLPFDMIGDGLTSRCLSPNTPGTCPVISAKNASRIDSNG